MSDFKKDVEEQKNRTEDSSEITEVEVVAQGVKDEDSQERLG